MIGLIKCTDGKKEIEMVIKVEIDKITRPTVLQCQATLSTRF